MMKLRWIATLCMTSLFLASGALATTIQYGFSPGATLQMDGGAIENLGGGFTLECPDPGVLCNPFNEDAFDFLSISLHSTSFNEDHTGPAVPAINGNGIGISFVAAISLTEVGLLKIPPEKDASFGYGFDAVQISSTPEFDRYRVWYMYGDGTYTGGSVPETIVMQLTLEEAFIDLGLLGIVGWTVGQTAVINFTATQVIPEPSTAILLGMGLVGLATFRRAISASA